MASAFGDYLGKPVGKHRQILLENIAAPEQNTLAGAEKRGAYAGIRLALKLDPLKVIEEVKTSNLRGRGGAGFPTGVKWSFVPRGSGKPVYLVCNADESEPGTFKDRLLLERDPHLLLEGIMIACWALQSNWSCIYIRGEYTYPYVCLKRAVAECYSRGYLGRSIFDSGFSLDIVVHRGAGAYICGEESAALESIEGRKGEPRLKPPFPAVVGLYGCPTVINNVETLAAVPWIIRNGGAEYSKIGTPKSSGTKLVSASGHINNPGVYEIEMGYPVTQFIEEECGGVWKGRKLKALIPGGSSVNVLRAEELEGVNMDYESLRDAGSSLGCAGFMVLDETTDMVQAGLNLAHFYAHESCGQCTPCREGGHWVEKIYRRIANGSGLPGDLALIESICNQIGGHTICAFGDTMVFPLVSIIRKFPEEFRDRLAESLAKKSSRRESLEPDYLKGGEA